MISAADGTYTYFPGCSQVSTHKAYDRSTRAVADALGIRLEELEDWNCCGATAYVAIREKRSFVLSARNLALAEPYERDLVTPCSACYVVLKKLNKYMAEDEALREEVRGALAADGMDYRGTVKVRHFIEIIVDVFGEEEIRRQVSRPLAGLRVVPYYGCQLTRPFGEVDDEEFPEALDQLIHWLGASPEPFPLKAKCCGGLMMTTQPDVGRQLTGSILRSAVKRGADCIITCCPMCQFNLEAYQRKVGAAMGVDCRIPVLYFTQLVGYAFGLRDRELGIKEALTHVGDMLSKKVVSV